MEDKNAKSNPFLDHLIHDASMSDYHYFNCASFYPENNSVITYAQFSVPNDRTTKRFTIQVWMGS